MLKECPNCHELVGENVQECFNCKYDFNLQRVKTTEEQEKIKAERQEKERQIQEEKEREQRIALEKIKQAKALEQEYIDNVYKNAMYEYHVELVPDLSNGQMDYARISNVLNAYAKNRWKLHTIVVNETGKTSSAVGIGGINTGVNATIDVTMMVFERCIEPDKFE